MCKRMHRGMCRSGALQSHNATTRSWTFMCLFVSPVQHSRLPPDRPAAVACLENSMAAVQVFEQAEIGLKGHENKGKFSNPLPLILRRDSDTSCA